mgnify:CR=1 FL=1
MTMGSPMQGAVGVSLRKGFTLLVGGAVVGQAFAVAAAPLLSRLYAPSEFGVYATYAAVLSLLLVVASLRYEMAVPLPEDDPNATDLLALALAAVLTTGFVTGIVVLVYADVLTAVAGTPLLRGILWFLPLGVVAGGGGHVLGYWALRRKRFGTLSSVRGVQAAGQATVQIAGGLAQLGSAGLVVGSIVGQALSAALVYLRTRPPLGGTRPRRWPHAARKYRNFPLYATSGSLVDNVGLHAPVLLLTHAFGLEIAGHYALTFSLLNVPLILVGQAAGQVLYSWVADNHRANVDTARFVEQASAWLLALALPAFAMVATNGPELFSFVLGERWRPAGRLAQYLAPWFAISLVSAPLSGLVLAVGRQRAGFAYSTVLVGLQLAGIGIGIWLKSAALAVALFSAAGAVVCISYIGWILSLAGSGFRAWLRGFRPETLSRHALILAWFAATALLGPVASIAAGLFGMVAFYSWLAWDALAGRPMHCSVLPRPGVSR